VLCIFQIPPEQLSAENSPSTSIRILQEEPHFVALSTRATSPILLWSLTTTLEQIALREILLIEEIQGTWKGAILKEFEYKMNFKF
jgi:hypothetical protein